MNLLRLFEFYLASMFVMGVMRRFGLYQSIVKLGIALARRYQRLLGRVKEHSTVFFTWTIFAPIIVTAVLWLLQTILTRIIFPHAELTTAEVLSHWWYIAAIGLSAIFVLTIDTYFLVRVGKIDAGETEKYFHQAESWIGTWRSKAIKMATLGYVNPEAMVDIELRKALASGSRLIHVLLWWTALQTGARVLLGLSLWIVCASMGKLTIALPTG